MFGMMRMAKVMRTKKWRSSLMLSDNDTRFKLLSVCCVLGVTEVCKMLLRLGARCPALPRPFMTGSASPWEYSLSVDPDIPGPVSCPLFSTVPMH